MLNKLLSIFFGRTKILGGAALAVGFLIIESLGFFVLTRQISSHHGIFFAGQISMMLYIAMLLNVLLSSLGIVISREVAAVFAHETGLNEKIKIWCLTVNSEKVILSAIVFFSLLALIINSLFIQLLSTNFNMSFLMLIGLTARGAGLISSCRRVGIGNIGADKGFSLLFSLIFYLIAIISVSLNIFEKMAVPLAYFLSGILSFLMERNRANFLNKQFTANLPGKPIFNFLNIFNRELVVEEKILWSQYRSLLLTAMAGFFVTNGDVFVVNAMFGSKALASYSVASKLGLGIFSVAAIYPSMQLQQLSQAYSRKDIGLCRRLWIEGVWVAVFISLLISLVVYILYPFVVEWVTHGNTFLNRYQFFLLCISAILMTITAANGWAIIGASKASRLCKPTVIDAIFTMVLGYIGAEFFGVFGLLFGIIIAHFVSTFLHAIIAKELFLVVKLDK